MKKIIFLFLFLNSFNICAQQYLAAAKQEGPWGGAWGYIDTTGNWVIKPIFQEASAFSEGFAKVKYSGNYGFIDKKGDWVIKPIYPAANDFKNGLAKVVKEGWGFIDTTGTVFLKLDYAYTDFFSYGFARVKKHLGWRIVDSSGAELKTVDFIRCESFKEGLARVEVNGKWGFIDPSGALVIEAVFQEAGDFNEGLAWARLNGKVGYIDKKGIFKIKPNYKLGKDFSDSLARVYNDGRWSFINKTGKTVIAFDNSTDLVSVFTNGFARIQRGGVGYINKKGYVVVEPKYIIAKDFKFGAAAVRDRGNFNLIDTTGKVLTKTEFAALDICNNGFVRARVLSVNESWGFIDFKGNWIIKPQFLEVGMFVNVDEKYQKGYKGYSVPFGGNINDFR